MLLMRRRLAVDDWRRFAAALRAAAITCVRVGTDPLARVGGQI